VSSVEPVKEIPPLVHELPSLEEALNCKLLLPRQTTVSLLVLGLVITGSGELGEKFEKISLTLPRLPPPSVLLRK